MKLMTYNIKRLEMKDSKSVTKVILEEDADVCALQEVPGRDKLISLFENTEYDVIFDSLYYSYGNGLVYKRNLFTHVGSTMTVIKDGKSKKSVLNVKLLRDTRVFNICVTHLDHRFESQRLLEVRNIFRMIESVCILLGDFNALTRSDYSDEEWKTISSVRKQNGFELPKDDVTTLLQENNFVDTSTSRTSTSRFNTRVDYVFVRGYNSSNYRVIDNPNNQSDHKPVVVEVN